MIRRIAAFVLSLALLGGAPASARPAPAAPVTVGIVAINDFHGNLEPPRQSTMAPDGKGDVLPVPAGGAAWLASAIDSLRRQYRNHLTVSAGDLIGGSPFASALFLDEPTIEVMNRIGLDYNAVGNHEFDSGQDELRRKQNGGCARFTSRRPCQLEKFRGARFPFLAANVVRSDGSTLFPATAMRSFGSGRSRVKVGLIGMTLKGTGLLSSPDSVKGLTFTDEADTASALARKLRARGADAVVLLIHQGGRTTGLPDPNGCTGLNAEIVGILDRLDTAVDVVVSGHTHWDYVCDFGAINPAKPFLLTSAGLWGKLVTDITLEIDPRAHRVVAKRAHNVIVQSAPYDASRGQIENTDLYPRFQPRADIAGYVGRYGAAAQEFSARTVGTLAGPAEKTFGKDMNTGGPLGSLIADAQLAATTGTGAQIAFMNPFGVRRSLYPAADGSVTYGDIYAVQPFNNALVTLSYTGAEIRAILEQGFDAEGPEQILSPSAGFTYAFDRSRPVGQRIAGMTLNGTPLDPAQTYRVTVSEFLANGGDTYTAFTVGRDRVQGPLDLVALEAWLKAVPPRVPPADQRTFDARPDLNAYPDTSRPGIKYR